MKKKDIKGRPQKHKDGNTFKFKSFNSRVAEVSVDLRTQLLGSSWKPAGDECYFYEAYTKWTDLNRTQHFSDFQKDVRGKIQSYPLVVYHKDAIVEVLQRHLAVPESLALEPLLDLLVNLAKDLQDDFFQFFPRIFQTFLDHLFSSQDAETLEWTFSCLSQLFRIQRRQMMKNLEFVFKLMIPLFEEGRKDYVIRFATESFAFLIRDFKDCSGIVEFLFSYSTLRPDLAAAIGELLFEAVKNVNHHLHSVFEKIYPVFLGKLRDERFDNAPVERCVCSMTDFLRNHISKETSQLFWNVFLKTLEDSQSSICRFHCLIFLKFVEFKHGSLLLNPGRTMTVLSSYIAACGPAILDSGTSSLLASAAATLLQYNHFNFDMQLASRMKLIRNVFLSRMAAGSKFQFAHTLHDLPQYQTEVLPSLLNFCLTEYVRDFNGVLVSLISLVLDKDPEQFTSGNLSNWEPFLMDFGGQNTDAVKAFSCSFLDRASLQANAKDLSGWIYLWALNLLAPHIRPVFSLDVLDRVLASFDKALLMLEQDGIDDRFGRVLCQTMHSSVVAVAFMKPETFDASKIISRLTPFLRKCPNDVSFLSTLEVALAVDSSHHTLSVDVVEILRLNLRDRSHAVRRITLHILDRCSASLEDFNEKKSVYQICLLAELVEPSVHDYREKLRFLRMLDYGQVDRLGSDASVPLLYLFGCLKIGFQLVWKEIKQLIASYQPAFLNELLWPLVEKELRLVSMEAETAPSDDKAVGHLETENGLLTLLDSQHDDLSRSDSNPLNAHKYRIHLWQAFTDIVGVDTTRNRIFSELFQRFMRNEFLPATLLNSSNEDEEEDLQPAQGRRSTKKSRAEAEDTVCVMLELLTKLQNPMALQQDPVVRAYLLDLVTYRTAKVQSAALQLLFNYKLDYIRPYEEHLMKLLDETLMWNTLAELEFGAANPVIQECHRSRLVPLIIRILFGRMQAKNKSRNTDKAAPRGRKEAIVRTLANCRPEEFQVFLDLTLNPCSALLSGDFEKTTRCILMEAKLPSVHLKLADGVLQTLFVILDELRSGAEHCIHQLFRAIVGVLAIVVAKRRDIRDDSASGVGLLKKLRKECYRCLSKMCAVFPALTFSQAEQAVLLDVAVWPEVDSVVRDGPFTVTPLMRLILTWSQHTSYHDVLAVTSPDGVHSPLGMIVEILNPSLNANLLSVKLVIEVLDHLLNPGMLSEESGLPEGTVVDSWTLEQKKKVLTPYAGIVLRYLQHKLTTYLSKKNRKSSPLTDSELRIASGISELSLDAEHSHTLLDLLLSLLETCETLKRESDLLSLFDILQRLVNSVAPANLPGKIRALASLLAKNFPRDARTLITRILIDIAERVGTDDLKAIANTACDLLSWNPRHIEEPDYERRGLAYQEAKQKITRDTTFGEGHINYALLVLHVADYDVRKAHDILSSSLRELGLVCILAIIQRFSSTPHGAVILTYLSPLVKEGLKNRVDVVRNAFIAILGEIVDFYPNHALFRDLAFLHYPANKKAPKSEKCRCCNSEGVILDQSSNDQQVALGPKMRCKCYNSDLDVFENLRHMQKHRVGSAFHDLGRWCVDKSIPVSTMQQYFLPLATVHLCNDQYIGEKYQGLINAVIELVGAVCSQLTWPKYEPILKHFLNMMTRKPVYQRQLIRVVVAIVDAFHFDLSRVDLKKVQLHKTLVQEKESNPALGEMVDLEDLDQLAQPVAPVESAAVLLAAGEPIAAAKADKIYRSLTQFMIPGLSKLITDKTEGDNSHKLTADLRASEREEILRAPVALAIVKLLQKLPVQMLRRQIPGVFLKIARMLKSRLLSVRQSTRETLAEIMLSLGPSYLGTLIKELRGVLKRGYQIHVLVHCVHLILTSLLPMLKSGDLDRCLADLVQICHEEMFGELAEEKEVTALTRKIAEARNIKSYDTYAILARYASPGILVRLIKPLKEKAEETQSHKVAVKLDKAFRQILSGLMKNGQLTEKDLLLFSFALYDQSTGIFGEVKQKKDKTKTSAPIERPDSYLIVPEPGRAGPAPATNRNTNDYLVQDFGLQILQSCFKNGRLQTDRTEHADMLDPFASILVHCLSSRHMPVKTTALRCLIWMLKFKLPSLERDMPNVVKTLFVHLKNYSGPGAAVSENAEFVTAVYKALSSTVRDATTSEISDKHLKVLLTYAESDFREGSKQLLAFNLLKAVLSRHLLTTELREIMLNLAKISIQGEEENLRLQCRHLVFMFVTTYNPKKIKAREFVDLFIDNVEYPLEHGRLVCITVLGDLLGKMGDAFRAENSLTFFQLFAARLSDESSLVRHKAAESISVILQKGEEDLLARIYKWTQRWLTDEETPVRRIGFQAASLFVQVEKVKFLPKLKFVLTALAKVLKGTETLPTDDAMVEYDHLLINALGLLANIIDNCGNDVWTTDGATKKLTAIFDAVRELLLHEHEWVRIRSLEVYWRVFQQQTASALSDNKLFRDDPPKKLASLTGALINQLKSYSDREDYYVMWSKCILYVLQAVACLPLLENSVGNLEEGKKEELDEEVDSVHLDRMVSLPFAIRGVCREAVYEALYEPKKTTKRIQVVTWIRNLSDLFDKTTFLQFLPSVLQVLYRCSNEPSAQKSETLKRLTEEVASAVENHVGREVHADAMKDVIIQFSKKRANRKRQQAVEPILNPEKVARKKIKKQQTKKEQRKRKTRDVEMGRLVKKSRPR